VPRDPHGLIAAIDSQAAQSPSGALPPV
jgi:hypothetical protein